jgi:hypothetical protein
MKNLSKTAFTLTAGILGMMLTSSVFADWRPLNATWRDGNDAFRVSDRDGDRDHERISFEGRIRNLRREREGYRVEFDRQDRSFWVPFDRLPRGRDLRIGLSVRFGGSFRNGFIVVDDVGWLDGDYDGRPYDRGDDRGYDRALVRGFIDRIDYRRHNLWLRDEVTRRIVMVDMRDAGRFGRFGLDDLRRGDHLALSGVWARGGIFDAYRIDDVRTRY